MANISNEQDTKVQVGSPAPNFTLPDQKGQPISLSNFVGDKNVVLYFYPKDNTPGCTAEACAFRDSYEVFKDAGAEVIGVSADSETSHQGFASRNRLPFILLSDRGGNVSKLYGVRAMWGLLPGRVTFIIDKQGIVRHIFSAQFAAQRHVEEALRVLEDLREE